MSAENFMSYEDASSVLYDYAGAINSLVRIENNTYNGADLAVKFADEIKNYSDVWAWIKARITVGNFSGINVCDYIEVTTSYTQSGNTPFKFKAQIAGINTYKGYRGQIDGKTKTVTNHIDFISESLFPVSHSYNIKNTNNGNNYDTLHGYNWLASELYLWLNSLDGSVPSATEGEWEEVNYTQNGVLFYLPESLKSVIVPKMLYLPIRYSENGQINDDNGFGMAEAGKLWLPDEVETFGMPVRGGKTHIDTSNAVQYPIFAGNMRRVKYVGNTNTAGTWWSSTALSGDAKHWVSVSSNGPVGYSSATDQRYVPICFRVMA